MNFKLNTYKTLWFFTLFLLFAIGSISLNESMAESIWPFIYGADLLIFIWLLAEYRNNGPAIIVLLFISTYYLAPLPYFLFDIPIVPYKFNVNFESYVNTLCIMSAYLAALAGVSSILLDRNKDVRVNPYRNIHTIKMSDSLMYVFWVAILLFMFFTFKGEPIVNTSGENNWDLYVQNLQNQSGALEYFFLLMLIGYELSTTKISKVIFWGVTFIYIYFCFTRGFRVQVLEISIMIAVLKFEKYLTLRNVFLGSIIGFLVLQAHGAMKMGTGFDDLFAITMNGEMRTNQTEVFYTSNNVINPILQDETPALSRLYSLSIAMLATIIPAGFLPDVWHSTISSHYDTGLPGGGGGLLAGHYFYWLSYPGVLLAAFLTASLFKIYKNTSKADMYYVCVLLFATSPRWMVYEPIALFYRVAIYYLVIRMILKFFIANKKTVAGLA